MCLFFKTCKFEIYIFQAKQQISFKSFIYLYDFNLLNRPIILNYLKSGLIESFNIFLFNAINYNIKLR